MNSPAELINLSLNAQVVLPEGAILLAMIGTLVVDLAGEKTSLRWSPPICYSGLLLALILPRLNPDNDDVNKRMVVFFSLNSDAIILTGFNTSTG